MLIILKFASDTCLLPLEYDNFVQLYIVICTRKFDKPSFNIQIVKRKTYIKNAKISMRTNKTICSQFFK